MPVVTYSFRGTPCEATLTGRLMNPPLSDHHLISQYLAGDQGAFDQLVNRYQPHLYTYLRKKLFRNEDAIQEILQRTWIRVIEKLPTLRDHDRFCAWVGKICVNACKRWSEQQYRHNHLHYEENLILASDDVGMPRHVVFAENPENLLFELSLTTEDIQRLIDRLPEKYAKTVRGYYFEHRRSAEMASEEGITPQRIQARLRWARAKLRSILFSEKRLKSV